MEKCDLCVGICSYLTRVRMYVFACAVKTGSLSFLFFFSAASLADYARVKKKKTQKVQEIDKENFVHGKVQKKKKKEREADNSAVLWRHYKDRERRHTLHKQQLP